MSDQLNTTTTPLPVNSGGTGNASFTTNSVLSGGNTSTAAIEEAASVGTSGQVFQSAGAGARGTMTDFIDGAKVSLCYNQTTPAVNASQNVTSVSDDSTGVFTVTIATDFSSASYYITGLCQNRSAQFARLQIMYTSTKTAGAVQLRSLSQSAEFDSTDSMIIAYGTLV